MLGSSDLVGFVATTDLAHAKGFYGEMLGLEHLGSSPVAHVFSANGTTLRISLVEEITAAPYTVLGWSVTNIEETIRALHAKGVRFERFPGMNQDEIGVWRSPGGDRVAWFKDPDGNTLSLTEGV